MGISSKVRCWQGTEIVEQRRYPSWGKTRSNSQDRCCRITRSYGFRLKFIIIRYAKDGRRNGPSRLLDMDIPTIMREPSKIRIALVYHLGVAKLNLGSSGFSKIVHPVPSGAAQGSKSRMAVNPLFAVGFPAKNCGSPPTLAWKIQREVSRIICNYMVLEW